MSLSATAEVLADDAQEIGLAASMTAAQAWAAGVDPEVTRGMIAAALALGCGETPPGRGAPPVRTGQDLVDVADLLASDARGMLGAVRSLQAGIAQAAAAATAELQRARSADLPAHELAQVSARAARVFGDCDCAAELAADLAARLDWAIARLGDVSEDLEGVYEPVYDLMARGGLLPYAGDWLNALLEAS